VSLWFFVNYFSRISPGPELYGKIPLDHRKAFPCITPDPISGNTSIASRAIRKFPPPATAGDVFQQLRQAYGDDLKDFILETQGQTEDEINLLRKTWQPKLVKHGDKFVRFAKDQPKDPLAITALIDALRIAQGPGVESIALRSRVLVSVQGDQLDNPDLDQMLAMAAIFSPAVETEELLRLALEKSPHEKVRGYACLYLGKHLERLGVMAAAVRADPDKAKEAEVELGKELIETLLGAQPEQYTRAAEQQYQRVQSDFAKIAFINSTLGDRAAASLFALRNLTAGKQAPEISALNLDGNPMKLSDFRGKVVVLVFTGHWCGPCRAMYPEERELMAHLRGKPFTFVGVNTDRDRDAFLKVRKEEELTWPWWFDGGTDGPITTRWNIEAFPTTFVLDQEGIIRHRGLRGEELKSAVEKLLPKGN
jgi:peroxiredoxin